MGKPLNSKLLYVALVIIFISVPFIEVSAQEGSGVQVLSTEIENDFPDGLTFKISLQSQAPITGIKLYFKARGDLSTQSQPIDFEPGTSVDVSYTWDTSNFTVAPSTPITYYWQASDEEGNSIKTPEQQIYYDDIHFNWQELRSSEIILRWYEGDHSFGTRIFDVATRALNQMKEETQRELEFPVIILLYANEEDFTSWQYYSHEWVGALAYPRLGITAQILPSISDPYWIYKVIPHEMAHLFFYQVINADIYFWPSWLDEGLAQYYEFTSNDPALERVIQAAHDGELLPLVLISGDFGSDPERAHLAYDQSYAVVVYMLETWGGEGLGKLVTNFREGLAYREAIEGAYGLTWEEFEASWITWLGVPTTAAPPPTPTAPLISLITPQAMVFQTATQDNTTENELGTASPTLTSTVVIPEEVPDGFPGFILVGVALLGLGVIILIVIFAYQKRSPT